MCIGRKHENTTMHIKHLADSANFKGITFNKLCSGLTGKCFDMPNDFIYLMLVASVKDDTKTNIMGHRTYISFKTEDEKYKNYIQDNLDIDMID